MTRRNFFKRMSTLYKKLDKDQKEEILDSISYYKMCKVTEQFEYVHKKIPSQNHNLRRYFIAIFDDANPLAVCKWFVTRSELHDITIDGFALLIEKYIFDNKLYNEYPEFFV